jgi:RNA polymerase sigma factor (TIGR02999 family)
LSTPTEPKTSALLAEFERGDRSALDRLLPVVYGELRKLAARQLTAERRSHTLQTTALVHEAYLRLVGQRSVDWRNRAQFLALAAQAIRRVLVDHARKRGADVRGGGWRRVEIDESIAWSGGRELDFLALDSALARLSALNERQARVIELRFFAGLSVEETAHVLDVSPRTIDGDWSVARAWLAREIEREPQR